MASNGQQKHSITVGVVDQFIAWALPLLRDVNAGDENVELALEGLREFLTIGDVSGIEGYILPILKACQELLEDERTSLNLLRQLLNLLTLVSLKFGRCFQPHFVDIVDLLLGWALVPDLLESDRNIIMHSFLQFQKHWLNNLQFSLGLLSKFLGDMEVLLQDSSVGTPKQLRRLLALLSCFSTILQVTASGMLEMNLLEQIQEPLSGMLPQFLACLSVVGKKFGWSKWVGDFWGCLLLLSEILCEKFAPFYPDVMDILFQCLKEDSAIPMVGHGKVSSSQVQGVLKTNLQLLSLQKFGLLPSSVEKLLLLNSPLSQLRLHLNHLVTGCVAATYLFVLQHGCERVVGQAISSVTDELSLLKCMLGRKWNLASNISNNSSLDLWNGEVYSDLELVALFKFDLKMLLTYVCANTSGNMLDQVDVAASRHERSVKLASFILEKLNPFELPIQGCMDLQVHVLRTLQKLSDIELLSKLRMNEISWKISSPSSDIDSKNRNSLVISEYLRKYNAHIIRALDVSSPLSVKLEALEWIRCFCMSASAVNREMSSPICADKTLRHVSISSSLLLSVLDASSDRESKVRSHVAAILELLLLSGLIHPGNFYHFTETVLERIGDVDAAIKNSFMRLIAIALPVTVYECGVLEDGVGIRHAYGSTRSVDRSCMHWKQVFALKQLPRQLHSQLLVSVLSYISQRGKTSLGSWIQRLVFSCRTTRDSSCDQLEERGLWVDLNIDGSVFEKICSASNLAAVWWAIQEAARYCVSVRLRTNLGGPTQTFAALERMLLDVAHLLQIDNEQIEGNVNIIGSSSAQLLPMRLLLDYVESLKKNVYNAYDGSIVLPSAPRQSSLFFRANKKVCEEWFARICEPMMNAGLALQCHSATVNYCTLRLQDFRNLVMPSLKDKSRTQIADNLQNLRVRIAGDVLRILRHMALALCRSHEPEALVGLQKWVTITFLPLFVEDTQLIPGHAGTLGPFSWISGLVYQAQGQYEKAAAHFSHLLQTEEILSSMGSEGIQFSIARIVESYTAISDWKSLEMWLLELQALRSKHVGKSYSGALTTAGNEMNAIHALARFDDGDAQAAWGYLDLTPKSSNELTLNPKLALQRSEQMLLQAMLNWDGKVDKFSEELAKARLLLEEVLSVVPLDGLAEAAAYATQLHCIFAFEEGVKTNRQHEVKHTPILSSSLSQVLESPINTVNQDCAPWLKILRVHRTISPNSPVTLQLSQKLICLARKQKNFMMAHRLHQYLKNHILACGEVEYANSLIKYLHYEGILLMYAEDKQEEALMKLWSMVHSYIQSPTEMLLDNDCMLKAKASLKLVTWLRRGSSSRNLKNVLSIMCTDLTEIKSSSSSSTISNSNNLTSNVNSDLILEEINGVATKLSSVICPTMDKAWLSYASWCYNQAQGCLSSPDAALRSWSLSPILLPELPSDRFHLTGEEILRVEAAILPLFDNYEDLKDASDAGEEQIIWAGSTEHLKKEASMKALVQHTIYLIEAAAGAPGVESSSGESPSSRLTSELQMSFLHVQDGLEKTNISSSINELIDVWWSLRKRRVSLFGHAAHGYLQFLSLNSSRLQGSQGASSHPQITKQSAGNGTLRATLYVLHILLNYGVELRDTLEPGLATVPLLPWQEITPQLFARLSSHPEKVVRNQLEGLLMMLAKLSPWSIVYPTLVDVNAYEGDPSEELQQIMGCLGKFYPKLVQDVQLLIHELGAMTVLWEEQWLSTLQDLHTDVMRRINVLKEEAARIADNTTLSNSEKSKINAAKYSAMMAPIVVALERRLASTSRKPETDHELWFHEEYGEQLKSAISTFKTPPVSASALGDVWRPFAAIAASLAAHQRKSTISLHDVAPQLSQLSSSDIPMPGLEKQISVLDSAGGPTADLQGIVTISSFCDQVAVLSTKTKPKKLVIQGSDGHKYTYLLKGREDLRLDARIMQLLQAVNGFLCACASTSSHSLAIRYYSVTPISGRAGLIQWVENVISIYSIFKSWQNRLQLAQLSAMGTSNVNNVAIPPVPRPSDMFYGKIIPALKEKGIRRVISRRDWPHEVKRKVLLELMKETPRHLLLQEIWCASEGFKAFSSKMKRFSGSVAAMSMVGHILGLGDRHLDNILIDFRSGEVVHIDYNVCFEKGQRLKIPEIVPFRLTQIIETALGLTGIEGTYRANCEAVLDVLRKNKDIILMLLEVFVWDPLVEWTRGESHDEAVVGGEERKGMELAVSLSLFASRVQEIRVPLQEHHDLLLSTIPAAETALESFLDVLNQYEVVSALFYHADQERSNLLLHETSAKSIVAEATNNLEKTRTSFEVLAREFAQAKDATAEKAQEAAIWIEQHGRVLDALRSGSIPEVHVLLDLGSRGDALSLTSAVMVAGVPLTVVPEPTQAQCHDLDREVSQFIVELDGGISCAITALQAYVLALQRILPLNYITTSPVHGWAQVLQQSVSNLSSDALTLARRQAADLIAKVQGNDLDSIKQRYEDLCLNMEKYAINIQKVEAECSELVSSIGSDAEAKSRDRLLSAFTKYMQSAGYSSKEDNGSKDYKGDVEEKKVKVLSVLYIAVVALYDEVKGKVLEISCNASHQVGWMSEEHSLNSSLVVTFGELEEQIEKCALISGFVNELQQLIGVDTDTDIKRYPSQGNWASVFQAVIVACRILVGQMMEVVLPEVIRLVVSYNSEVMDAFGSLSQIRGSIDTALEQLVEVELERASLIELEQSYFVKVGRITEQQLALEEAALKSRDHLSWEEAEELATQEEACRAQLDELHQTWNQKDMRSTSLTRREANIKNALASAEQHFLSLINSEQGSDLRLIRSKALLATLAKPFSELESIEQTLSSFVNNASHELTAHNLADAVTSGYSPSELIWKFASLLNNHSFFIWKISVVDSFLDSCIHDISSVDHNFGFDQLYDILKKKLEHQLQERVGQYLQERVAPALLVQLEKENESLKQLTEATKDFTDQVKKDVGAVNKVQRALEEYCDAHETARAAGAAVSQMKRHLNELTETLRKTSLEIVQMEWLHDLSLSYLWKNQAISQNFLGDDELTPIILDLNRSNLLESLQSAMTAITKSVEGLQVCERTSMSAEGQLERAMGWACAGSSTSNASAKNSGIPSEFHDHLMRRRQLLWAAKEQASEIMKTCTSVMEFEASRDGLFRIPGEISSGRTPGDGRTWQQTYMSVLTRLDVSYHSFSRAEKEWKVSQSSMEAAANSLFSATNELCIASVKAKSASGDLQGILAAMQDHAYEAHLALSGFGRVTRVHTALTSECGSMLEEVLAITKGLHDVYTLGKEAAAMHSALMEDLSKASMILLPLESMLSKDVAAMSDAISRERESKMEISPMHGQALYQSYSLRLREACQSLKPLVPSLTYSVRELHALLTRLARTASIHAGNLHKALEGLGDSEVVRSQEIALSRSEIVADVVLFEKENTFFTVGNEAGVSELKGMDRFSSQEERWISPPNSIYSSSTQSSISSTGDGTSDNSGTYTTFGEWALHIDSGGDAVENSKPTPSANSDLQESFSAENPKGHNMKDGNRGDISDNVIAYDPSKHFQGLTLSNEVGEGSNMSSFESKVVVEAVSSLDSKNEACSSNEAKGKGSNHDAHTDLVARAARGKNAYAVSVLRRVEMKLDGRDSIDEKRQMTISEQVDHLLKQATSIDNLCNMYEGWTPWI